ncbi:MAG: zinc metalloprotease HtpX [Candidatus Cloacimonetes bacterium]|nr:zinc metalloprotease HtpX [Candidatus Cloacimonadota bacterium]
MQTMKVFLLMAGLTALLVVIGGWIGGSSGALVFFVFAEVMNFAMYWWSDKVVLRMYRAKTVGPDDAPELYRMVDRLRQRAGLPMPTVAVAPSQQPNAFATGRNQRHAVVCVTTGIMQLVSREELEGVIAHELAHIKHRHMLVSTVAATMAGAIAMIGNIVKWGAIFGGFRGDEDDSPVALLAMAIVAPIAAMIIQLAISRANEFQADRTAAEIVGRPDGLANALRKLEAYAHRIPMDVNPAAAQLAIVNPLSALRGGGVMKLFSTHPPTEERVRRLVALAPAREATRVA